jgi:haloalkane dehalogenase
MAYVEVGNGDPIVFLHGNPTSSYLWRNIIPYLEGLGRCIAPDLIGMGDSDKLPNSDPNSYTFVEHRRYLDALLDALGVNERVTFVVHDWGSALGFDWSYRHPDAVKGIAYMEAIVKPGTWSEMPEPARKIFQALRSEAGEQMVLEQNSFIEVNLPNTILRRLTEEEMNNYGEWLSRSDIPKFYIQSDPGTMLPSAREFCRAWPAQSEVTVRARHYPQEDSPDEVGQAIANWLQHPK